VRPERGGHGSAETNFLSEGHSSTSLRFHDRGYRPVGTSLQEGARPLRRAPLMRTPQRLPRTPIPVVHS
jgi:hypothetical protein